MKKQTKKVLAKLLRSKRKSVKTRELRMEMLEGRRVMAGDASAPLHNALIAADVNRDFTVSPLDALLVINALHTARRNSSAAAGEGELPATSAKAPPKFYDVSNDGRLSPLDALMVINKLRAEGEDPVKLVSYSVQFFDVSDTQRLNPITQASVGQTIIAQVYVKDLRKLANPIDLPDFNNTDPDDGGSPAFPIASEGDVDRNGNGIVDIGPDDTFATGVFSAGVDLDLTGSEAVGNLVTHVRPAGGFLNSITFGPRLSGFPDGSAGAVDSDQEFNEISGFDLSLNLDPLQDQNIDPTRFENFFSTRFTLLKTGTFTITPNAAEDETLTNIRFFRNDGITVPAAQQTFIGNTLTIVADATSPVAVNDEVTTAEETALVLAGNGVTLLTGNDRSPANRSFSVTSIDRIVGGANPTLGSLNGFTYTPPLNFNGTDRVTYTITDSTGLTATATVTISVTPVNDPPVAVNDTFNEIVGDSIANSLNVLDNDNAGGGETQALTIVNPPATTTAGGTLTVVNNVFQYTPPTGYEGPDSFSYTISDGQATASATVSITVITPKTPFARSDAPPPMSEISAGGAATGITINVLSNDKVNDGVGVRALLKSFTPTSANGGTITRNENGTPNDTSDDTLQYVPAFEFQGTDTFTYVMNDTVGTGEDSTGIVTVTVTDVNDVPTAGGDTATGTEDIPVTVLFSTLLSNDSPGLGESVADRDTKPGTAVQTLTVTPGTSSQGTVSVNSTNSGLVFTPNRDVNSTMGPISFTYTITDNGGQPLSAVGTVVVTLAAENDAPIAGTDSVTTNEDVPLTINVATLTNNDAPGPATATDEANQLPLTITAVTGNAAIVAGNIVYTPQPNFNGNETFTYTVRDSAGGTSIGTVNVTVNAINDRPNAGADSAVAFKGVALQIPVADLLANDNDGDTEVQQSLSIVAVSNPVNGTVSLNAATGIVTFTPATGYAGPASFQYTLQDSGATGGLNENSATGTVSINVRDFVPTDITGKVWVDETRDGVINSKERMLGGVHIVLTGNAVGIPIQPRTYITLADGSYRFEDLAPGEYVVTYRAPSYMEDGVDVAGTLGDGDNVANQFTISIPQPGGAIATDYNFAAAGINPSYGRAMDLLASRFLNQNPSQNASQLFNGLIAAIGADNSQLWLAKFDGFDGMVAGEIVLNSAGNRAQVTMVDANENVYTTSLTPSQFGVTTDRATGNKIVRVFGDISAMNFQKINLAAPPVVSINRFLDAIDEVFAQEGWDGI